MAPGTTTTIAIAATTKAANSVDLGDWSFRNWPAVVFHYVKSILFFVSALAGVLLVLALVVFIVFVAAVLVGQAVTYFKDKKKKDEPTATSSESQGEGIPMQDHEVGDEEAAEQPLMGGEGEGDDVEELPPRYDGT